MDKKVFRGLKISGFFGLIENKGMELIELSFSIR
jgi:hypothetical protein